jgi:hypothetical protein
MEKTALAVAFVFAFLAAMFMTSRFADVAEANPGPATSVPPVVNVSEMQVHATISQIEGEFWAVVDATYHVKTVYGFGDTFLTANYKTGLMIDPSPYVTVTVVYDRLEAYYLFPPDATNKSVKIDGTEVNLLSRGRGATFFGSSFQELTWITSPVPSNFSIAVHYEHRVRPTDTAYSYLGKRAFLFSLGARFGLDGMIYGYYGYSWFDNSTAQFDVQTSSPFSKIRACTAEDIYSSNYTLNPLYCAVTTENGSKRAEFALSTPSQLPPAYGIAVFLDETPEASNSTSEPSVTILAIAVSAGLAAVSSAVLLVHFKKRKR